MASVSWLFAMIDNRADDALHFLSTAYPIVLLVVFLVSFLTHSIVVAPKQAPPAKDIRGPGGKPLPRDKKIKNHSNSHRSDFSPGRKAFFQWTSVALVLTFLANAVLVIIHVLVERKDNWWCGQHIAVYIVASFFLYALFLISIIDTTPSPTLVHGITWSVALLMEISLLGAKLDLYSSEHREPSSENPEGGKLRKSMTQWEAIDVTISLVRILSLFSLTFSYALFIVLLRRQERIEAAATRDSETAGLLSGENGSANGHAYGATQESEQPTWVRPDKIPSKSWWEYIRGYSLFFPYLWPAKSRKLQMTVVFCFILVILARAVNILVPTQLGRITDALAGKEGVRDPYIPWGGICLYIFFRFMQGNNGLIGALRSTLWVPISQWSYQELSTAAFEHVHGLSLDFHLGKKTGEVLSALSKGNSINTFLEQVTFQVFPMLVDLAVAIGYLQIYYDAYYALVVTIITFVYLYMTIRMAQWRADIRREMVNFSRQEDAVKNDSMVSYETVKYFNAERYEFQRYRKAVQDFQGSEYKVLISLNIMNVSQNTVFTLGLLIVCFIAAYQVSIKQKSVGDFTGLVAYMTQLQAPLNFFGTFYRSIQYAMINSERMLELFKERPTVEDDPEASDLPSCEGDIHFNDVRFAYDSRKPALKGLSFRCQPGTTTALVGESGGGKSTIFRLLFRFYNPESGSIQVDGHDVTSVTIDSLRRHIGVVPQDTVLFNESIMYNLKYANPAATDEQVHDACKAASIHERILGFPDGYESRVGERGLKLSGGEKQRVAIARTILKNPRIILLDEATAALDSETEMHIQEALDKLSQGRTSLVIAHRLSTITTADQILVLHAGQVVESGTHEGLLATRGRYANMWKKQIRAQKAAAEAKVLTDRAEQLRNEAHGDESATQSEDERSGGNSTRRSSITGPGPSGSGGHHGHHGLPHGHP